MITAISQTKAEATNALTIPIPTAMEARTRTRLLVVKSERLLLTRGDLCGAFSGHAPDNYIFYFSRFPVKTISPCPTLRSNRDKWGMGVRQALFPMLTFGAPISGAVSFPTPFSTASGVFGLVAGPSSALRPLNFK